MRGENARPSPPSPAEPGAIRLLGARIEAWEKRGRFSWALALGDAALAAWLLYSIAHFTGAAEVSARHLLTAAPALATVAWLVGLHHLPHDSGRRLLLRTAGLAAACIVLGIAARALGSSLLTGGQCVWFGIAFSLLLLLQRLVYSAWRWFPENRPLEMLRILGVGTGATLAVLPYYQAGAIGAGDAYWYSIMLADVVEQFRAGVFPVWVGQSEYAFNGTVYPLRLAPLFQYFGGAIDWLTAGALGPTALKNAVLAIITQLGAFSAYACLRAMLPLRPGVAAILALLWIGSPGVLAPLMRGDQYMTVMTLPFIPLVLYGSWRIWTANDLWARLWIAIGLAGALLAHAPVASWLVVLAGGLYVVQLVLRRDWRREILHLTVMGTVFAAAGSWPVLSAATLDNQLKTQSAGSGALHHIQEVFPDNFLPVDATAKALTSYQLGYTLIVVYLLALGWLAIARPKGARPLVITAAAFVPITLPVPVITEFLWVKLIPTWFVTINNVWPMQRLFLVWTAVVVFTFAATFAAPRLAGSRRLAGGVLALLMLGAAWSAREALQFAKMLRATQRPAEAAQMMEHPDNVLLTRYAYASFSSSPAYASHGYMEPWLENRILHRESLEPVLSNADAAAPLLELSQGRPYHPRLAESGILQAVSDNQSDFHNLQPPLGFRPGRRYALRLEFMEPGIGQYLQVMHPTLFREYMLPDSGAGFSHAGPPRAFGSLATSSGVLPLIFHGAEPVTPVFRVIMPRREEESFPLARYWLYEYNRAELPIAVRSWVPYRAETVLAVPGYLETPRLWLKHWRAFRNGQEVPVVQSPNNLVMAPVEPGTNEIVLKYDPPWTLKAACWTAVLTWTALLALGLWRLVGAAVRRPEPARRPGGAPFALH